MKCHFFAVGSQLSSGYLFTGRSIYGKVNIKLRMGAAALVFTDVCTIVAAYRSSLKVAHTTATDWFIYAMLPRLFINKKAMEISIAYKKNSVLP